MLSRALVGAAICAGLFGPSIVRPQRPPISPPAMEFSGTAEVRGKEIDILGTLGPAAFFRSLSKTETPDGPRFAYNGSAITAFPKKLIISVIILNRVIPSGRADKQPQLRDEIMKAIKFEAHWKRGMEMRPVEQLTLKDVSTATNPSLPRIKGWVYTLILEDVDAPITDHLILDLTLPEGKNIARLSAHL